MKALRIAEGKEEGEGSSGGRWHNEDVTGLHIKIFMNKDII